MDTDSFFSDQGDQASDYKRLSSIESWERTKFCQKRSSDWPRWAFGFVRLELPRYMASPHEAHYSRRVGNPTIARNATFNPSNNLDGP